MTDTDELKKEENEQDQSAQPAKEASDDVLAGMQKGSKDTTSPPIQVTGGPRIDELREWHVAVLCYRQDGDELELTEEPIGVLSQHNRSIESPFFRRLQHNQVYLVLREQQTQSSLFEGRLVVAEPHYRLHYWLDKNNQTQLSLSTNTPLPVPVTHSLPEMPQRIQLSMQPGNVALCFVIDGTMTEDQLALARSFALSACNDLYDGGYPLRVGHILYGEYRKYPLLGQRHAFEVDGGEFDTYPELYDRLIGLSASNTFANQDYCDALELGLSRAVQLNWSCQDRYLVLLGNSPPHPTPEERETYQLLDYTCDEFEPSIDWRHEHAALVESGVRIYSYMIGRAPSDNHDRFIKDVWRELDSNHQVPELNSSNLASRWERLAQRLKESWPSVLVPSEVPSLPVLETNQ